MNQSVGLLLALVAQFRVRVEFNFSVHWVKLWFKSINGRIVGLNMEYASAHSFEMR